MSLSKLGVLAGLALAASAVLIPPSITAADLGNDAAMEGLVIDPFRQSITLDCPTCPFATAKDNVVKWVTSAGNTFVRKVMPAIQPCGLTHGSFSILRSPMTSTCTPTMSSSTHLL